MAWTAAEGGMSMKHVVMMSEDDFKEIVRSMNLLRTVVNSLEGSYMADELDAQLERVEKVISKEELV